jgi:hypothetical protein
MSLNLNTQISSIRPLFSYLKKQQENRQFIKSVEITATFILITFFLVFAVRPTVLTIAALKGDIESKKILKEELKTKINQVIMAQDAFSQVQERYAIVNSGLPDLPNYYDAASIIQQVGQNNAITVADLPFVLDQEVVKDDPRISTFGVTVGVNGPFLNAVKIASDILRDRRTSYINSINFTSGDNFTSTDSSPSSTAQTNSKFTTLYYYWPPSNEKK